MIILENARLLDGTGHDSTDKTAIIIEGNRIKSVESVCSYLTDANVVDLQGLKIMPGLIDTHLHLGGFIIENPGSKIGQVPTTSMFSFVWDYFRDYARRRRLALENGVTTIRSAGDHYPHIIKLRDKINSGKVTGPRIFTPGPIFTATGGHPAGTIYKRNKYVIEHVTRQVDNVITAKEEVNKLVADGVDCIKAVYGDIDPMDLNHKVPKLSFDTLEMIVNEAHNHKLRVMVHTGNPNDTREAVEVGADSIEHGILPGTTATGFDDGLIELMLDSKTYFVPTLAIGWAYKDVYPAVFSTLKRVVKQVQEAGVAIAVGTDSGTPGVVIGKAVHMEMALLVEAGLSPMAAIEAATKNAAENLGEGHSLGTIEVGKIADIIVVTGNPLENISNTRNIKLVIQNGKIIVNRLGFRVEQ